jgi:tagatose-6-phosphate ketose/aldose isomerase
VTALSSFVDLPVEEKQSRGLLFTPAEIAQQPKPGRTTLRIFEQHQEEIAAFLDGLGVRDRVGGTSGCAVDWRGNLGLCRAGAGVVLRQKWGCEVSAVASTDLLPNLDEYVVPGRKYLWISFSRSGDSPEGVAVLEQAIQLYPEVAHLS